MRPTFANIMSVLAVFIALGGTSYAALAITGADVVDESLASRDVKNGALRARDINKDDLRSFREPGPQGERGPSNVVWRLGPEFVAIDNSFDDIVGADLPAGRWLVTTSVALENNDTQRRESTCQIMAGNQPIRQAAILHVAPIAQVRSAQTIQAAIELAQPTRVKLQCAMTGQFGGEARRSEITAIEVAEIDGP